MNGNTSLDRLTVPRVDNLEGCGLMMSPKRMEAYCILRRRSYLGFAFDVTALPVRGGYSNLHILLDQCQMSGPLR